MLEGIARKISYVLVFASAVAWIVFDTGFGMRNAWQYANLNTTVVTAEYFNHWLFALGSVPLYFMFFVHLLCGNKLTAAFTLVFVPIYLVSAGGVLQINGAAIHEYLQGDDDYVNHIPVEFSGVFASVIFFWVALVLWAFHSKKSKEQPYINVN